MHKVKLSVLEAFKSKFTKPCSKIFCMFKIKLKRHSCSLRPSRFRRRRFRTKKIVRFKKRFSIRKLRPKASKLKLKRPDVVRIRISCRHWADNKGKQRFGVKMAELVSVFRSKRLSNVEKEEHVLMKEVGSGKEPFPSPITPAFIRANKKKSVEGDVVDDDEYRSFESHLAELIVEEGKLKDLVEVEELLKCTRSLKSPVFLHLVSRFYGDLQFSYSDHHATTLSQ